MAWLCASGQDNGCEGDEGGGANKVLHRILARIFLIIVLVGSEIKSGRNKDSRLIFTTNHVLIRPR